MLSRIERKEKDGSCHFPEKKLGWRRKKLNYDIEKVIALN
jgi:hypothetical protein